MSHTTPAVDRLLSSQRLVRPAPPTHPDNSPQRHAHGQSGYESQASGQVHQPPRPAPPTISVRLKPDPRKTGWRKKGLTSNHHAPWLVATLDGPVTRQQVTLKPDRCPRWTHSSAGRALARHARGARFDPWCVHCPRSSEDESAPLLPEKPHVRVVPRAYGVIAQLAERPALNREVGGSLPSDPTCRSARRGSDPAGSGACLENR